VTTGALKPIDTFRIADRAQESTLAIQFKSDAPDSAPAPQTDSSATIASLWMGFAGNHVGR